MPKKYLLEQNKKYYSIKSGFYKDGQYQDLEFDTIIDDDFKNKGFDNLEELLNEININEEKFKPLDKLKQINNGYFNIIIKQII